MPRHNLHRVGSMVWSFGLSFCLFACAGCYQSATTESGSTTGGPPADGTTKAGGTEVVGSGGTGNDGATAKPADEEDADIPKIAILEEIDGISIPRLDTKAETLQIKGELPRDVGNDYAKSHAGEPATGDWLIVRFTAEPKSLNPVVETSAVQSYIGEYLHEGLVRRDPESMEWVPHIAHKWIAEDAVKLSADFPERERRIKGSDGQLTAKLEVEYAAATKEGESDPVLTYQTTDKAGAIVGDVWVGLFPIGKVSGAPRNGYHFWSNSKGELNVSAVASGKYRMEVGAEVFGEAVQQEDGSLIVTPLTPGNPLAKDLQSSEQKSLTLKKGEWVDVQAKTIYTYFIRDDVKWSDGTPFTTDDMIFGYSILNNPTVDGESIRTYYQDVVDCDALDAHTIRMKYRQQYFMAFEFTSGLSVYSPPLHVFTKYFADDGKTLTMDRLSEDEEKAQNKVSVHGQVFGKFFNTDDRYNNAPVGTGPYIVDKWERNDRVELRRNAEYWNTERRGYLDRLIFKFIPDSTTAFQALKAGEIDFMWNMSPEQFYEDLADNPEWFVQKYVKASWYSPGYSYYGWNLLRPLFQDQRVRVALSLLFDKQSFLEQKLHNAGVVVSGSQYYFGLAYDHAVKPLGYSVEVAKELLAEAGWADTDNDGILDKDGQKFEFELLFPPGSPSAEARAAIIQKSYKDVGIVMTIRNYEWASFIDKVKSRDYDAINLGWAASLESDPFQLWHGSGAGKDKRGSNHVSFQDAQSDDIIETLRLTLDEEKRHKLQFALHRILDREQPYMFLYTSKDFGAYHHRFQGVKWYRLRPGFDFTEWYVPKDQQIHK
ncbi:MAG: ABC transporter substrate-binding protein [Planctomycetaceae bacterium]